MDRPGFNNPDNGIRRGYMRDEANIGLEKSKKEENRRKCRDEWRELLWQAKSGSQDGVAHSTSIVSAAETADGQWRARIRQSSKFCNLRGFKAQ
jgi:hypothetical protein